MKIEKVAVNASPLIVLFKSGLADLLPRLFTEVVVPEAVWEEVIAGGESDAAASALPAILWLRRVTLPTIAPEILVWNLGDGEAEVLSFTFSCPEYRAMIDDRAARRVVRGHWGFRRLARVAH